MNTISQSELGPTVEDVIDMVRREQNVVVTCEDGTELTMRVTRTPVRKNPLDIPGVPGLTMSIDEIVALVREGRERDYVPALERKDPS